MIFTPYFIYLYIFTNILGNNKKNYNNSDNDISDKIRFLL